MAIQVDMAAKMRMPTTSARWFLRGLGGLRAGREAGAYESWAIGGDYAASRTGRKSSGEVRGRMSCGRMALRRPRRSWRKVLRRTKRVSVAEQKQARKRSSGGSARRCEQAMAAAQATLHSQREMSV